MSVPRIGELVRLEIDRAKGRAEAGQHEAGLVRLEEVVSALEKRENWYHACIAANGAASLLHFTRGREADLLAWRRRALADARRADPALAAPLVPMFHALVAEAASRCGETQTTREMCDAAENLLDGIDPGTYRNRIEATIAAARSATAIQPASS